VHSEQYAPRYNSKTLFSGGAFSALVAVIRTRWANILVVLDVCCRCISVNELVIAKPSPQDQPLAPAGHCFDCIKGFVFRFFNHVFFSFDLFTQHTQWYTVPESFQNLSPTLNNPKQRGH